MCLVVAITPSAKMSVQQNEAQEPCHKVSGHNHLCNSVRVFALLSLSFCFKEKKTEKEF